MIWMQIKAYSKLILSALLFIGGFLLSFFVSRSRQNRKEKQRLKAQYEHVKKVMKKDVEIELEFDERTKKLKEDVEKNGTSDELNDPNKGWK